MKIKLVFSTIISSILAITIITNTTLIDGNIIKDTKNKINLKPIGTIGKDWTLEEIISDTNIKFSSFKGKVILLDFFATWCTPCLEAISEIKIVKDHYDNRNLEIISVDTDPANDLESEIEKFADENGINWKIVIDKAGLSEFYEIASIPTFYLFNQEQKVHYVNVGVLESSILINEIDDLLSNPETTNTNSSIGFWFKNWYWFLIVLGFISIGITIYIQRIRIIRHNKRAIEERLKAKELKHKRYR